MASIVTVVDDLDGTQDATTQTRVFDFGGASYEIDLSDVNAKALAEAQDAFAAAVEAVRVFTNAGRVTRRKASTYVPARSKEENDAIRNWANSNGFSVSDKGRIPEDAVAAFDAAHAPKNKD